MGIVFFLGGLKWFILFAQTYHLPELLNRLGRHFILYVKHGKSSQFPGK